MGNVGKSNLFHFKEKRPLHRIRLSCGFMETRAKWHQDQKILGFLSPLSLG